MFSSKKPKWEGILHRCHNRHLRDPPLILRKSWIRTVMTLSNNPRSKSLPLGQNIIRHNPTIYKSVQDPHFPFFRIPRPVIKNSVLLALLPQTLTWDLSEKQMRTESLLFWMWFSQSTRNQRSQKSNGRKYRSLQFMMGMEVISAQNTWKSISTTTLSCNQSFLIMCKQLLWGALCSLIRPTSTRCSRSIRSHRRYKIANQEAVPISSWLLTTISTLLTREIAEPSAPRIMALSP